MRFVLTKGRSQYGSLRMHVDQLAAALAGLGHEAEIVDLIQDEGAAVPLLRALSRPVDCLVAFGGVAAEIAVPGSHIERPDFLYVALHVDHPVHHLSTLAKPIPRQAVFFLDRTHVQFLIAWAAGAPTQRRFAHIGFLPPGADVLDEPVDLSDEAFAARDIGLLFTGTYRGPPAPVWEEWPQSPARALVAETVEAMIQDGRLPLLDSLRAVLARRKVSLSADLMESLAPLLSPAQFFVEAHQRHALIKALGEGGAPLQVHGAGWEAACADYPTFRYGGLGDAEETLRLLRRARLVLNSNNGFIAGGHERVFAAMSAGAAVISDASRYYADAFKPREMASFSWSKLDQVAAQIAALSDDPPALAAMARAGAKRAQAEHSWAARAAQLVKAVKPLC